MQKQPSFDDIFRSFHSLLLIFEKETAVLVE